MATSRVRSTGALARAIVPNRPAGTIASRNGSATVALMPRRNERRGSGLPLRICIFSPICGGTVERGTVERLLRVRRRHSLHPERITLHNANNEIRHLVTVRLRIGSDATNGRLVVILHTPTERVRHEIFCKGPNERRRTLEERLLQLGEARDRR